MAGQFTASTGQGSELGQVVMVTPNARAVVPWEAALEFGLELRRLARPGYVPDVKEIRVLANGHVDVLLHGRHWFNGPRRAMAAIGDAIVTKARQVEEEQNARFVGVQFGAGKPRSIIADQALLMRSRTALPMMLTSNPAIAANRPERA